MVWTHSYTEQLCLALRKWAGEKTQTLKCFPRKIDDIVGTGEMLVTTIFLFSYNVSKGLLCQVKFIGCSCFEFGQSQNISLW